MKIYIMLSLCVLFWSGNFIIGRAVSDTLSPIELAFLRWSGVFILFLPFIFIKRKIIFEALKKHTFLMLGYGILGVAGFNTLLYIGLSGTKAINALLINSSIPILILFLSSFLLKTKITRVQFLGIIVSTLGVIYLVFKGDLYNYRLLQISDGDIWIVFSSLTWALYSVLVKKRPKSLSDMEFFASNVFIGFLVLFPLFLLGGYDWNQTRSIIATHSYELGYVVLFPSIASFYLWHKGIERIGASKTGQFTHLMPIFGTTLAVIFLNESFLPYHAFGMSLVFIGIYLSLFIKKAK